MNGKLIDNFIEPNIVEFLTNYVNLCKKVSKTSNTNKYLEGDGQMSDANFVSYGDIAIDTLLETYLPKIQEVWDKPLYPSFSYIREYKSGTGLEDHRDRIGSDVTCSVKLTGPPFPFTILGNGDEYNETHTLGVGQALVWNGNTHTHGHGGQKTAEDAIHLLLICTEHEDQIYDKRQHLGLLPETREGKENYDYKDPTYGHDETNDFLTTRNTDDTTT